MNRFQILIGLPVLALALAGPLHAQTGQGKSDAAASPGKTDSRGNNKPAPKMQAAGSSQKAGTGTGIGAGVSGSAGTAGTGINADAGVSINGSAVGNPPGGGIKQQ
jgi:hypothetical protein